jgi:hypothetical protein
LVARHRRDELVEAHHAFLRWQSDPPLGARSGTALRRGRFESPCRVRRAKKSRAEHDMAAATTDYEQIVQAVQLYVGGFKDGDPDQFREAFHEDAWIFYTDAAGTLHKNLISESFEEWASERSSIDGRVISVRQAGDVASKGHQWPVHLGHASR